MRLVALIGVVAASLALTGVGHASAREPWDAASDAQRALSEPAPRVDEARVRFTGVG